MVWTLIALDCFDSNPRAQVREQRFRSAGSLVLKQEVRPLIPIEGRLCLP
jgi:hypothetical protein